MSGNPRWADKQREIAQLFADGKEFKDIAALGYSNYTVSSLKNALAEGQNPKLKAKPKPKPRTTSSGC